MNNLGNCDYISSISRNNNSTRFGRGWFSKLDVVEYFTCYLCIYPCQIKILYFTNVIKFLGNMTRGEVSSVFIDFTYDP